MGWLDKAELLAAVWMANHPDEIAEKNTIEGYVRQFDFLVKNFQSVIETLEDN